MGRRSHSHQIVLRHHLSRGGAAARDRELGRLRLRRQAMKKEWVAFIRRISDLSEGKQTLFIKDLTPGPRKYDTKLVQAEIAKSADKLPDGDVLWTRSETGYLHPQPWKIKILQELS